MQLHAKLALLAFVAAAAATKADQCNAGDTHVDPVVCEVCICAEDEVWECEKWINCNVQPLGAPPQRGVQALDTNVTTPAPETPAPETPAPVTPAPVTPAPVTSAPVTPAPVTSAPVTPVPVTSAPVTPAPEMPAPVTPAPVTPAPVTPAPVTPAPVTSAPVTPVPTESNPLPPIPATLVESTLAYMVTIGFGPIPDGVTAAMLKKDVALIQNAIAEVVEDLAESVTIVKICAGEGESDCVEIPVADLAIVAARLAQALAEGGVRLDVAMIPKGDAKIGAAAFAAKVVDSVKKSIESGNSPLTKATPSSGAFDNISAESVTGSGKEVKVLVAATPTPAMPANRTIDSTDALVTDDDLSGGEIAAIVVGLIAVFALIGAAVLAMGSKGKPVEVEATNEPIEEEGKPAEDEVDLAEAANEPIEEGV